MYTTVYLIKLKKNALRAAVQKAFDKKLGFYPYLKKDINIVGLEENDGFIEIEFYVKDKKYYFKTLETPDGQDFILTKDTILKRMKE